MKKLMLGLLFICGSAAAAERYEFDSSHTYPNFTVDHLGFSTMYGRFNETTGHFVMDRKGKGSSLFVLVQTDSIDTGHDKRDKHLRNADFFDTGKHPTMTYRSTKVSWKGDNAARVDGELTLLGVTKPLSLDVQRIACASHPFKKVWTCGFDASATLKRSDFGMNYGLGVIGDEIALSISAEGVRQEKSGPR